MTTKEKISQFIDYKGISKRDFYRQTGLSNGFLDSGKYIGSDNVNIIISTYPELNLEWLIMNEGEMLNSKNEENINKKNVNKKVNENVNNPNVQKTLTSEKQTGFIDTIAEERAEYGKTEEVSTLREQVQDLKERLIEQKELYTGQLKFLTNQIENMTKDKDERIQEYRDRIRELKGYIETLKNVSPMDGSQEGVG